MIAVSSDYVDLGPMYDLDRVVYSFEPEGLYEASCYDGFQACVLVRKLGDHQ